MRRLPPLASLQVFEVVARHRSFTRAAEHLCLTQGAVSRQILALEEHYHCSLFVRGSKGLTLTVEGEILLPVVRESLARIEEVSLRLTRQRTDLALKVPTCVMRWVLPKVLRFQSEHPQLQVKTTTTWQHDVDFTSEPFDAAIIYGSSPGTDVHAIALFEEQLIPVCVPELLEERPLAMVDDLAACTLLHPTRDHRDWKLWLDRAGATRVDPNLGLSFETLDLATNAAMHRLGVAISDKTLVGEDIAAKRLVTPFETAVETGFRYYFVYPDSVAHQPKVELFRDWIMQLRDSGYPEFAGP
ncbi:LysR substrate-binding domain-containing protein [Trinickia diaoshuihuensis]|uniref:LysR substrate-binding domain-containing protein n=1 Tax=Trinickia diaoshuihuensis TaxID=2292265 RepID=UPI000E2627AD|nr:LysR substrate-binding domain-containing protein [Trinickia diaoshuihuensis]